MSDEILQKRIVQDPKIYTSLDRFLVRCDEQKITTPGDLLLLVYERAQERLKRGFFFVLEEELMNQTKDGTSQRRVERSYFVTMGVNIFWDIVRAQNRSLRGPIPMAVLMDQISALKEQSVEESLSPTCRELYRVLLRLNDSGEPLIFRLESSKFNLYDHIVDELDITRENARVRAHRLRIELGRILIGDLTTNNGDT